MAKTDTNKVIIITGASSGIGAAVAKRLARESARITLAARRQDKLTQIAADVEALGGEALIVPTDVRKRDDIQRMIQTTLDRWGRIDVLINNAGVGNDTLLIDFNPDKLRDEVHINLIAVIECAQAVLPIMLQQKSGHIVNVASLAGLVATPGSSVYSATKFGVNGFSDALRREIPDSNIKISVFCPGYTPSEISPTLKAIAENQPDAPHVPGLMPITYVADQLARLIERPRRRLTIPPSWRPVIVLGQLFPALADLLLPLFQPKED